MATAPVNTQTLTELVDHVVGKHHSYLKSELPYFSQRLAKMTANHGADRPYLFEIQNVVRQLTDELMAHLQKEEMALFPYVKAMDKAQNAGQPLPPACFSSVQFPIRMMTMEHDMAESLLVDLRRVSLNYTPPEGACNEGREFFARLAGLEVDLREHIRIENELLFPLAIAMEASGR